MIVSQGYDTTPIRKNQFILDTSAFPLSFLHVIIKNTWTVEDACPYKTAKDGVQWNYHKENQTALPVVTTVKTERIS